MNDSFLTLPVPQDMKVVGCFGFNGPLSQYFSLYRAVQDMKIKHNNAAKNN